MSNTDKYINKINERKVVNFCGEHYLSSIIIGIAIPVAILLIVALVVIFV